MPDYKKMYHILFNEMNKAIDIMQKAQCITEEIYTSSPEAYLTLEQHFKKEADEK